MTTTGERPLASDEIPTRPAPESLVSEHVLPPDVAGVGGFSQETSPVVPQTVLDAERIAEAARKMAEHANKKGN